MLYSFTEIDGSLSENERKSRRNKRQRNSETNKNSFIRENEKEIIIVESNSSSSSSSSEKIQAVEDSSLGERHTEPKSEAHIFFTNERQAVIRSRMRIEKVVIIDMPPHSHNQDSATQVNQILIDDEYARLIRRAQMIRCGLDPDDDC